MMHNPLCEKNACFLKTAFNANPFRYNHPQIPHKQKTLLKRLLCSLMIKDQKRLSVKTKSRQKTTQLYIVDSMNRIYVNYGEEINLHFIFPNDHDQQIGSLNKSDQNSNKRIRLLTNCAKNY